MSGIQIEGDVSKLRKQMEKLSNIDTDGINAAMADAIRSSTVERFSAEKAPDGSNWQPSKRAQQQGGRTLVDTARLRNSIRSKSNSEGFAVGTNVVYAATHQFGDSRTIRAKSKKLLHFTVNGNHIRKKQVHVTIPPRPFLGVNEKDIQELTEIIEDAIKV